MGAGQLYYGGMLKGTFGGYLGRKEHIWGVEVDRDIFPTFQIYLPKCLSRSFYMLWWPCSFNMLLGPQIEKSTKGQLKKLNVEET